MEDEGFFLNWITRSVALPGIRLHTESRSTYVQDVLTDLEADAEWEGQGDHDQAPGDGGQQPTAEPDTAVTLLGWKKRTELKGLSHKILNIICKMSCLDLKHSILKSSLYKNPSLCMSLKFPLKGTVSQNLWGFTLYICNLKALCHGSFHKILILLKGHKLVGRYDIVWTLFINIKSLSPRKMASHYHTCTHYPFHFGQFWVQGHDTYNYIDWYIAW